MFLFKNTHFLKKVRYNIITCNHYVCITMGKGEKKQKDVKSQNYIILKLYYFV